MEKTLFSCAKSPNILLFGNRYGRMMAEKTAERGVKRISDAATLSVEKTI
jgi:hypothetical protein